MWIKTRELSSAKAEGGKKGWVVGMTIVYISVYSRWEEGSGGFGLWVDWVVGISERLLWIGGARVVSWVDDVDIDEELG